MNKPYRILINHLLSSSDLHEEDIESLFKLIGANTDLSGFLQVSKNLLEILPLLLKIDRIYWGNMQIKKWLLICQHILKEENALSKKINNFDKSSKKELIGSITDYPLYSTLWHYTPEKKQSATYYHLQAHFLNSYRFFCQDGVLLEKYDSIIHAASLVIRKIQSNLLILLAQSHLTTHEYLYFIKNLKVRSDEKNLQEVQTLERMFLYATGKKDTSTRNRNEIERSQVITAKKIMISFDSDQDKTHDIKTIIKHSNLKKAEALEFYLQGNAQDENFAGPTFIADTEPVHTNESLSESLKKAKGRSRSLSTNNQNLPIQWERLNIHDVIYLYKSLQELSHHNVDNLQLNISFEKRQELISLIVIMHFTATPIERALQTKIYRSLRDIPLIVKPSDIYYCVNEQLWVIALPELHQRKKASATWENYLVKTDSYICLPATAPSPLLNYWVKKQTKGIKSHPRPMFSDTNKQLVNHLKLFIKATNKNHNCRITPLRISRHIFHLLLDRTGDIAETCFMTGALPLTGQKAALYYYAPKEKTLHEKYHSLCNGLKRTINRSINDNILSSRALEYPRINKCIGSQICPVDLTVKYMIKDLLAKVDYYKKKYSNPSYVVDFHNAYTSYCVMLFGFITGYRAVKDPFYSIDELDWDSDFVVISDKDSDDYYNSRIVLVTELCKSQVMEYINHREALIERLILINPKLANEIRLSAVEFPYFKKMGKGQIPFFFFLNSDDNFKNIKSSTLQANIEWSYVLPLNANRHYSRTQLRQLKVPAELVDAFMGHWEVGQEPFGKFSTLSPSDYKRYLKKPLEKLTNKAGWILKKGLNKINFIQSSPKEKTHGYLLDSTISLGGSYQRKLDRKLARKVEEDKVLAILDDIEPSLRKKINEPEFFLKKDQVENILKTLTSDCNGYTAKLRHNYFVKFLKQHSINSNAHIFIPSPMFILTRERSPFTPDSFKQLNALKRINNSFLYTLEDPEFRMRNNQYSKRLNYRKKDSSLQKLLAAQILYSSIVNGGLLQKNLITEFGNALDSRLIIENNLLWLEISVNESQDDISQTSYRRWFPDPLTAMLILRWKRKKFEWPNNKSKKSTVKQASLLLKYFFRNLGFCVNEQPTLSQLINTATTKIGLTNPQYLIQYANKTGLSTSLPAQSWARLLKDYTPNEMTNPYSTVDSIETNSYLAKENIKTKSSSLRNQNPQQYNFKKQIWNILKQDKNRKINKAQVVKELTMFLNSKQNQPSIILAVAGWSINMMSNDCVSGKPLKASSMKTYFSAIAPPLILHASDINILELDHDDWLSLYDHVLNESKTILSRSYKAGRLIEFHRYLQYEHGIKAVTIEGVTSISSSVNANIISPREYINVQNYITNNRNQPLRHTTIQKLILTLGFRTGLRRNEVAKLRIIDFQDGQEKNDIDLIQSPRPEILIRNNPYRSIKSNTSIRRIPLYPLLTESELNELINWKAKRLEETPFSEINSELLFCEEGQDTTPIDDNFIDTVQEAMRNVCNDPTLRFHHLRHSFANITLLRLLNDDYHDLLPHEWIVDTEGNDILPWPRKSLRALLLLTEPTPTRKLLYTVSALCGHIDPRETLNSYLHLLDYIQGKELQKDNKYISLKVQANLLGISQKSIGKHRERNNLKGKTSAFDLLMTELKMKRSNKYNDPCLKKMSISQTITTSQVREIKQEMPSPFTLYNMFRLRFQNIERRKVAKRYSYSIEDLKTWELNSRKLANIKSNRDQPRFIRKQHNKVTPSFLKRNPTLSRFCPAPPHNKKEREDALIIHKNVIYLNKKNPILLKEGLKLYLETATFKKTILTPRNDDERVLFITFLRALKVPQHRIRVLLTLNSNKTTKEQLKHWVKQLNLPRSNFITQKNMKKNIIRQKENGRVRIWLAKEGAPDKSPIQYESHTWPASGIRFALFMSLVLYYKVLS